MAFRDDSKLKVRPTINLLTVFLRFHQVNLTNVVWVEYPAPVGFSSLNSSPKPKNEVEAAAQFLGFWKTFMETFDLKGRKVYLTGESYGEHIPL